jgi:hypothetical protein
MGFKIKSSNGTHEFVCSNPLKDFNLYYPNTNGTLITSDDFLQLEKEFISGKYYTKSNLKIVSGTTVVQSFQNIVGRIDDQFQHSVAFVYPPEGFNINNLVEFLPSINAVYFDGGVNADDILFCRHTIDYAKNRVIVQVGNSEQRANGYVNYLGIWRR